ncbi:MAG: response regulator [Verrucomicrobiota bacterium]|jgi:CheY-like chemotaxis protein
MDNEKTGITGAHQPLDSAPTGAPQKKVLVVDDNEIVVRTITLKLQGAGYQVIPAKDGSEAVALARKESPDLILLDISFPAEVSGMWDGFQIMQWFHRLGARRIPVIIITGSTEPEIKERATAAGAVAVFQKPLEIDRLLEAVRANVGL